MARLPKNSKLDKMIVSNFMAFTNSSAVRIMQNMKGFERCFLVDIVKQTSDSQMYMVSRNFTQESPNF